MSRPRPFSFPLAAALATTALFASAPADAQFRFKGGFGPNAERQFTPPRLVAPRIATPRPGAGRIVGIPDLAGKSRSRSKNSGDDVAPGRRPTRIGEVVKPDKPKRNPDRDPPPSRGDNSRPDKPKRPPVVVVVPPVIKPPKDTKPPVRVVCDGGRVTRRGLCICPPKTERITTDRGTICGPIVVVVPPERPDRTKPPRVPRPPVVTTIVPVLPPIVDNWPPKAPAFAPPPPSPPRVTRPAGPPPVPFVPTPALADATFVPDEVILSVQASAPTDVEDGIAQRFNLTLLDRSTNNLLAQRVIRYRIPDSRLVPAVVAALAQDPAAIGPQPNYLYRPQQANSAPSTSLQYALTKVDLSTAHDMATGRGTIVGIIDSGVDTKHDDLKDSDIITFDAAGGDGVADGHGTAIAGIIGARGTTRGIAPSARLLSARAFAPRKQGAPQLTTSFVLLKALDWTVSEKARVVNLSLAGPEDALVRSAIRTTLARGVIVVAAAGNNGRTAPAAYPAAYDGVIAATAIDADDRLYEKANTGTYVAVAAPGVDVIAPSTSGAHDMHTGTSFAAAHVTGIVALVLERKPDSTPAEVREILARSAFDLGASGRDEEFGAGRINAAEALKLVATSSAN